MMWTLIARANHHGQCWTTQGAAEVNVDLYTSVANQADISIEIIIE